MKHTISQAIVAVLQKQQQALTIKDIYNKILKYSLYEFKSKNPESIITTEIRRHCEGNPQSSKRTILFVKSSKDTYWLSSSNV